MNNTIKVKPVKIKTEEETRCLSPPLTLQLRSKLDIIYSVYVIRFWTKFGQGLLNIENVVTHFDI